MEIKGKVHCFFEQSGTFKKEFIKLNTENSDTEKTDRGSTKKAVKLGTALDRMFS